ncbi:hypothetical protein ADK67_06055 [Saccharothrix sp. NRRL B-16348]|uniref:DUF305 domain-containing protein n=1 Tax=Saccharothrix sp. NRRL B-16348 TaxID=1415542 RepID=UPI0006AE1E41|nr:DUF305 domain-containing protein [Saccharothrix sp. NRRL B-16348]KOX33475.1 hypothetical protein ADK67_06055 [Saccharothrix sp. NRRL B-16348]
MTRKNLVGTALAVLTTGFVLAGCGNGSDTGSGGHDMGSMTGTTSTTSAAAAPSGDHNDADITFAQGMIPHHQGALEMSKLVQGRTSNPKVLDLASRIEKAQDPEIKTMTDWLNSWGAQVHTTGMPGMDHGSDMSGMSAEDMEMLKQAKDADFDKMFLEMMIKHHQGAIDMSKTQLQQGSNAEAKKLAQQIIDSQQAEITEMQGLLQTG